MTICAKSLLSLVLCLLADKFVCTLGLTISTPKSRKTEKVVVPVQTGARCLDGSPYTFGITPGNASRWTIQFSSFKTRTCGDLDACNGMYDRPEVLQDLDAECACSNFEDAKLVDDCTCVNLIYCDGSYFAGHRDQPYKTPEGNDMYIRGRRNLQAAIRILLEQYGLAHASELAIGGHSVSGTTVILNADVVAKLMPSSMKIRAVPVAGFTLDDETCCEKGKGLCSYVCHNNQMADAFYFHDMSDRINKNCVASYADRPWACLLGEYASAFVKTPMFILNSRYDAWQVTHFAGLTYKGIYKNQSGTGDDLGTVRDYGKKFMTSLEPILRNQGHAAYISSCICHCACGPNGTSFFHVSSHGAWLISIIGLWYEDRQTEISRRFIGLRKSQTSAYTNLFLDDADANYDCGIDGVVQGMR